MSKVFIYPVSDKESAEDLNSLEFEKHVYWYAEKRVSFEEGDLVLIYVSGNLKKIKYICEVKDVYKGGSEFELDLMEVIDDDTASLLDYWHLESNGVKNRLQSRLILNNNPQLCSYISNVLLEHGYIDKDLCDENKDFIDEKKKDDLMGKLDEYKDILEYHKQIIFQGAPGTGKTRLAKELARYIIKGEYKPNIEDIKDRVKLIQFHPGYSYEDFVRGIVAKEKDGKIVYKVEDKILAEIAKKAKENSDLEYILIIDEINRANLSAVLGELIYALEYRDEAVESMYENEEGDKNLVLPDNLYIIGTMNTADRSVGHIDYAIRRRFIFIDIKSDKSILKDRGRELFEKVEKIFNDNLYSEFNIDDVMPGHSYFLEEDESDLILEDKLIYQIKPLLMEYIKDGILKPGAEEAIKNLLKS